MNHAPPVRVFHRLGDLPGDRQRLFRRNRPCLDAFRERRSLHQLQHQRALLDAVDGCDIGVVERGQHLGFARESRHAAGILGEGFGNHFDGHVAAQLGIGGAIHLAHPARSDGREDLISAEICAGLEFHS